MITSREAKTIAGELSSGSDISHSRVLEAVAHAAGFRDWNTFCALDDSPDPVARQQVIPILRVFDHALAREFYCDFLGFDLRWKHQPTPDYPVYAEVALDGSVLHLSEHHGDATPGSAVMITVADVEGYRDRLLAQRHRNARPGVHDEEWGKIMTITDPFGNRLLFWQRG